MHKEKEQEKKKLCKLYLSICLWIEPYTNSSTHGSGQQSAKQREKPAIQKKKKMLKELEWPAKSPQERGKKKALIQKLV